MPKGRVKPYHYHVLWGTPDATPDEVWYFRHKRNAIRDINKEILYHRSIGWRYHARGNEEHGWDLWIEGVPGYFVHAVLVPCFEKPCFYGDRNDNPWESQTGERIYRRIRGISI